jgi:hypothetical protein
MAGIVPVAPSERCVYQIVSVHGEFSLRLLRAGGIALVLVGVALLRLLAVDVVVWSLGVSAWVRPLAKVGFILVLDELESEGWSPCKPFPQWL